MATSTTEKPARKRTTTKTRTTAASHTTTAPTQPRPRRRRRPTHDQIAERAYFIYLQEGGQDELRNWIRAEQELAAA
jgi:hypothetical protein